MQTDMTTSPSTRRGNRIMYLAGIWSAAYGILGIYWLQGGAGFPFGKNDPGAELSIIKNITIESGSLATIILGFLGAIIALFMTKRSTNRLLQIIFKIFGISMVLVLFLVITDYRLLAAIAYVPVVLLNSLFRWFEEISLAILFPWQVINQIICIIGGIFWASATLVYHRQINGACTYCGRKQNQDANATSVNTFRWGKWATYIAVVIPLIYSITRYAWALGIPLGISADLFKQGQAYNTWIAGSGLATVAVCGSILTLGLIKPWGEVFPGWMLGFAGKKVPPALAIIPATVIAIIITSAGINFSWSLLSGDLSQFAGSENWAAEAPVLFWPFWGISLGIATLAYYYRRRGRCKYCGMI